MDFDSGSSDLLIIILVILVCCLLSSVSSMSTLGSTVATYIFVGNKGSDNSFFSIFKPQNTTSGEFEDDDEDDDEDASETEKGEDNEEGDDEDDDAESTTAEEDDSGAQYFEATKSSDTFQMVHPPSATGPPTPGQFLNLDSSGILYLNPYGITSIDCSGSVYSGSGITGFTMKYPTTDAKSLEIQLHNPSCTTSSKCLRLDDYKEGAGGVGVDTAIISVGSCSFDSSKNRINASMYHNNQAAHVEDVSSPQEAGTMYYVLRSAYSKKCILHPGSKTNLVTIGECMQNNMIPESSKALLLRPT